MNEQEPSIFDARQFFAQMQAPGLDLPERVEEAEAEARAWGAWHAYLAGRKEPAWYFDSARFGGAIRTHWPGLAQVWTDLSDRLLEGRMGHGTMDVPFVPGKGMDWNANPTRSSNWAGLHYMFFLRWPIRAGMLTGEARYVRAVGDCLRSYLEQMDDIRDEHNVYGGGVEKGGYFTVWNTLGIGLKLKAIGEALYAFRDHPAWTAEDCRNATVLIWRHADFLHRKLTGTTPAEWQQELNFISSGSGGLGAVGALLPEWGAASDWLEMARQVQETLLLNQVYPDGMQKEICTQYHCTVIRSFATLQMILARQGLPSFYDTEPFRSRFLAMHRFVGDILTPDGYGPALNSAVYDTEWIAVLASGNAFFEDGELQWHLNRWYRPETVPVQKWGPGWCCALLHDLCVPKPKGLRARAPRHTSKVFPDSGVAVLRDGWGEDSNFLVLDFGHPEGGHAYAAQASFTAWVKGKPAALSPGSPFSYSDPDYKPWYYGTRGQNTVWVDEEDQETWRPGRKRRVWGRLLDWQDGKAETRVRVAHDGYFRSKGIRHTRTALLRKGRFFLIYDLLDGQEGREAHVAQWTIRCPDALKEGAGRAVASEGQPGIRVLSAWPDGIDSVEIGWGPSMVPIPYQPDMSPQQGRICHARFTQRMAAGGSVRFLTLLVAGDCADASVRGTVTEEGVEAEVTAWGEIERLKL